MQLRLSSSLAFIAAWLPFLPWLRNVVTSIMIRSDFVGFGVGFKLEILVVYVSFECLDTKTCMYHL